jgi:hypothetical protein
VLGISEADYKWAANYLKSEVASVKAVSTVESATSGFLPSGRPKILFEGHFFYRLLRQYGKAEAFASEFPTICYPKWTTKYYLGNEKEYSRLELALRACAKYGIPESVALRSASWGKYQIMGDNYRYCGYKSVNEFVEDIFVSERNHLKMFVTYLTNTFLDDELRNKDWAKFAAGYNGSGYKRNQYDIKMAAAYKKFKSAEATKPRVTLPISTPITIPAFEPETEDTTVVPVPVPVPAVVQGQEAHEPAVKIDLLTSVGSKFNQFKTTIKTILIALGTSIVSFFSWFLDIIKNPHIQIILGIIVVLGLLFAGIYMMMWIHHRYQLHLEKNKSLKEYNLEQLRIRANPNLYNVQFKESSQTYTEAKAEVKLANSEAKV